ncbi:MAG: hypothetical protein IT307_16795, partial [Chloroflexi bacterium]|nr:hypothetical protein [Chloroflexota bacterium]
MTRRTAVALLGAAVAGMGGLAAVCTRPAFQPAPVTAPPQPLPAPTFRPRPFANRVGWAYSARPGTAPESVATAFKQMKELGCNTVYISHPNPGILDPRVREPGLAPAVWYAITRRTASAGEAQSIVSSVRAALEAAEKVGLEVLLGIGYQMQMGPEWNAVHRDDLRRDRNQQPLQIWLDQPMASPYSPRFQEDLRAYYRWVEDTILRGSGNVVALNLADEPLGADLSPHALRTFQERYGKPFDRATGLEQGDFLAGVVADYAAWCANEWKTINPRLWTMMTCHVEREAPFFPSMEKVFARTPETFVFSADTHLDDSPRKQLDGKYTNLLYGMVRTLGWLSNVYRKPLMLWTSANGWGLKGTGGLPEAFLNLDIVYRVAREVGGDL